MKFKTKSVTVTGEELKLPVTVNGVTYPVGSILITDEKGNQCVKTREQFNAEYDEIKPRIRSTQAQA